MSAELEQRLAMLGAGLEIPPAPDVVPAVLARLPPRRRRRRRPARRTLVAALAALLVLAAAAMAVPPTRHAILKALGLRGVRIERVPRLPPLPAGPGARFGLGERIPYARARHAAGFTALLPASEVPLYLAHDVPGGRISMLIGHALVIEFRGSATPFIFKLAGAGTTIRRIRIGADRGVYLSGSPHEVIFQDRAGQVRTDRVRLAGNVLLWQRGPLTVRIEGTRTLGQALSIAHSLR